MGKGMDLKFKASGLETFFSPTHQPHTISAIWKDKNKSTAEEMEPNISDAEDHASGCNHKAEQDTAPEPEANEDLNEALEWENGIGSLIGSDLKFRMNEHGDIEVITEDLEALANDEESTFHDAPNDEQNSDILGNSDFTAKDEKTENQADCSTVLVVERSNVDIGNVENLLDCSGDVGDLQNGLEEAEQNYLSGFEVDKADGSNACSSSTGVEKDVVAVGNDHAAAEETATDESVLEDNLDNLDTFDPVLSEDIATMLYDSIDNGHENKNTDSPAGGRETPDAVVSKHNETPSTEDGTGLKIVSITSQQTSSDLKPPQENCIICGRPSRLRRFCSRQCLGKNAAMTRKASYRSGSGKKLKYKKKDRNKSYDPEHTAPHGSDVLTVVQDDTDGKKNDLKIKIRWSSSSTEPPPTTLVSSKRRVASTGMYNIASRGSRRRKFTWTTYLQDEDAIAVDPDAFKDSTGIDPFPTENNFQCNMALEGVDPEHESLFCALSVAEVRGCRIRLRFCGYSECFDFWRNVDCPLIFPCGFCKETGRTLQPPKGQTSEDFDWTAYMREQRLYQAPQDCFTVPINSKDCVFKTGEKIEAVDKHNPQLTCVATVWDIINGNILVHFDGWNHEYDYWCHFTSQYIHPVGWCKENNKYLTPPEDYKGAEKFSWAKHLSTDQSQIAKPSAFSNRRTHRFKTGMKLEAVDPRNKILIRVATISEIKGFEAKIHFDGWSDMYDFWTNLESADIHPVGWCKKTGHPLQPPVSHEDLMDTWQGNGCPIPGCSGVGHVRGTKFMNHYSEFGCPYSPQNLAKEPIKDRLAKQRTRKSVRVSDDDDFGEDDNDPEYFDEDMPTPESFTVNTRRRRTNEGPSPPARLERKRRSVVSNKEGTVNGVLQNTATAVAKWSVQDVAEFIGYLTSDDRYSKVFAREEIDGEALLMLTQSDICRVLNIKLGPAIKIYNAVLLIKDTE